MFLDVNSIKRKLRKIDGRAARYASRMFRLALCFVFALSAYGCRYTDVFTEKVVNQESTNIDYDNPAKMINVNPNAELESEDLPESLRSQLADIERERERDQAITGEEMVDTEVPDTTYDEGTTSSASADSSNSSSTSDDSQSDMSEESGDDSEGSEGVAEDGTGGDSGDTGLSDAKKGLGGTGTRYDSTGLFVELPEQVQTCVAFGELANLVYMLAGEDSVVGSDVEFLDSSFIQSAFAGKGIDEVARIDASGTSIDVDQVIAVQPDALFLLSETYELTEEEQDKLAEAEIDLVYLPNFKTEQGILDTVKYVGTMFGDSSKTLSGEDALGKANEYIEWHNDLLSTVQNQNGGLTTLNGIDYSTGEATASAEDPANWVLFVNEWDSSAVYQATPDGMYLWTASGVAIARSGYDWSPLNYYLSSGGVNNNAAQFHTSSNNPSSYYYIWQFQLGRMPATYNSGAWSSYSIKTTDLANNGYDDCLVLSQDTYHSTSLGADDFRNVIVTSKAIAESFAASRLYSAYDFIGTPGDEDSGLGFLSGTGKLVQSYIGFITDNNGENWLNSTGYTGASAALQHSPSYEVIVNPHGLYSSWVDGSPEAVLEAVWAYDTYHGGDYSQTRSYVADYYQRFYGVSLASDQIDQILSGLDE